VYCSISGYGLRGTERDRPTYDIGAFWARSGLSVQMADSDGNPLNARGGIGDHITGLAALAGLLAAVMEQPCSRPRTPCRNSSFSRRLSLTQRQSTI
jgi:crotonobetainyl-CoA:carnitine CoA-transferase CaiB-like acyl-CoA transferase